MNNWTKVVAVEDVPRLGARIIRTDTMDIALFRTASDDIFALKDHCPHKGGPLSQGIVHDKTVTCPLHNWKIDLASGEAQAPDQGCSHRFPVKVENGVIYIQLAVEAAVA